MKNDNSILRAVQLIDENIHFMFSNQESFFEHLDITNAWKLTEVEFRGAYVTFEYLTNLDTTLKVQLPLFDYARWRRNLGK